MSMIWLESQETTVSEDEEAWTDFEDISDFKIEPEFEIDSF